MSWRITGKEAAPQLLDAYPSAAAAYSLRNLSWAYGGPVARVRRSSDSTEQDFTATQVTDGTLTTFCGAGDGFVSRWYDQSGNGINATQATNANQPQIVLSGQLLTQGGKAAIRFNGTSARFIRSAFSVDGFWFLVAKGGTGVSEVSFQSLTNSLVITTPNTPPINWTLRKAGDATISMDTSRNYTTRSIVTLRTLVNNAAIWVNGAAGLTDNSFNPWPATDTSLFSAGSANFFNGDVHELVFYTTNQTSDRTAIESNINVHYNIF